MTGFWFGKVQHVDVLVTHKYFMTVVRAAVPNPVPKMLAASQGYARRSIDNSNKNRVIPLPHCTKTYSGLRGSPDRVVLG